jgi:hypothetical protein
MFFKWLVLDKGGVDDVGREPANSSDNAVCVAMAHWNTEHRVFAVEQFFRNSDSVVTVRRLFRRKFNVERRGATLYSDGLKNLDLPDLSETFLSSRNRSSAAKKRWSVRCRILGEGLRMCVRQ